MISNSSNELEITRSDGQISSSSSTDSAKDQSLFSVYSHAKKKGKNNPSFLRAIYTTQDALKNNLRQHYLLNAEDDGLKNEPMGTESLCDSV